ncbi:MAG: hypothetical protein AB8V02_00070 [Francisella endosymbiont of Hyalomma asiaticum]
MRGKYRKSFIDLEVVKLLKQTSSQIKSSYIPVVFRYGAFTSTTCFDKIKRKCF